MLYMVKVVGNARVSPLRPRWVLAKGVATVFSAPARIMMKKEYLVDSAIIERQKDINSKTWEDDRNLQYCAIEAANVWRKCSLNYINAF